jgi:hypothetical protein
VCHNDLGPANTIFVRTARIWGGEQGHPGWVDVWNDTKGRQWLRSLAFSEQNASRWASALTG